MTNRIETRVGLGATLLAAGALAIAGCGGDTKASSGLLSFSMTDAPVDEAHAVVIAMTHFELKPRGEPAFRVEVNEAGRQLDLLQFTNGAYATIIEDEQVPAGDYEWLRIFFDMDSSYIELEADGARYPFFMPSGAQTGYKLVSGFTVPANGSVEYILDFDLRRSLISPPGRGGPFGESRVFLLKPTVRIMNVQETGGVQGVVADDLLSLNNPAEVCLGGDAVYAFEGHGIDLLAVQPLVTDIVDLNEMTGESEYHLMFLLPGAYTLGFTCSSSVDDGETYPPVPAGEVEFFNAAIEVVVVSSQIKHCDIPQAEGAGAC